MRKANDREKGLTHSANTAVTVSSDNLVLNADDLTRPLYGRGCTHTMIMRNNSALSINITNSKIMHLNCTYGDVNFAIKEHYTGMGRRR